jgi:hypothetical protein
MVAVGQLDAGHVAVRVEVEAIVLAAEITAGRDAVILVEMEFGSAVQYVGDLSDPGLEVVDVFVTFAVAGPVLDHARLAVDGLPAVLTGQTQRVAMAGHHAVGVGEAPHGIAVAVGHLAQLAVFVIAVGDQRFDCLLADDALDLCQPTQRVVVMQVDAGAARRGDVGEPAVRRSGEMQKVTVGIFDPLDRHGGVVLRALSEQEEHVIQLLQQVVAALATNEIDLLMLVVDAFVRASRPRTTRSGPGRQSSRRNRYSCVGFVPTAGPSPGPARYRP